MISILRSVLNAAYHFNSFVDALSYQGETRMVTVSIGALPHVLALRPAPRPVVGRDLAPAPLEGSQTESDIENDPEASNPFLPIFRPHTYPTPLKQQSTNQVPNQQSPWPSMEGSHRFLPQLFHLRIA
jgi:hypothetical protein